MVQRYRPFTTIYANDNGEYVRYEDYAALERAARIHAGDICSANNEAERFIAANVELEEENTRLRSDLKDAMEMIDVHYQEGRKLREDEFQKLKKRLDECHDKLRDLHYELFPEDKIK